MIVALLDTNVLASGLAGFARDSTPGEILRRWDRYAFTIVLSEHLRSELSRTLADPWFVPRVANDECQVILTKLLLLPNVDPLPAFRPGVAAHAEDDLVLATAVAANADVLVTGDRALLRLGTYENTAILSPAAFLSILRASTP